MNGIVAPALARSVDEMVYWPRNSTYISVGNIVVLQCMHKNGNPDPDKNNYGALALVVGSEDQRLLYPGDANFECIPEIDHFAGKLSAIIATHHGSLRSLEIAFRPTGDSIPKANTAGGVVCFSYGARNPFKHDMERVFEYYQSKGFDPGDATAKLPGQTDTLEITMNPGAHWSTAQSHIYKGKVQALESDSLPEVPASGTAAKNSDFQSLLEISGSDKKDISQDDLAAYAVRDPWGDVVSYNVIGTKIVVHNLPLCVPCITDFPVEVQIQCDEFEVQSIEATVPLVRFNVTNGPDWRATGNPSGTGREGEPGFAGGYLNLSVAGDWLIKLPQDKIGFSSKDFAAKTEQALHLTVQYRGGRGSNGQKGGRGLDGTPGGNGTDDDVKTRQGLGLRAVLGTSSWVDKGASATKGTNGGQGAKGGNAGIPSTICQSVLNATAEKVPSGDRMSFALDLGTGQDLFGAPAVAGSGGNGGKGGPGGFEGKRYKSKETFWGKEWEIDEGALKQAGSGDPGLSGQNGGGPPSSDSMTEMQTKLAPFKKIADTRVKLLAAMSVR